MVIALCIQVSVFKSASQITNKGILDITAVIGSEVVITLDRSRVHHKDTQGQMSEAVMQSPQTLY